MHAKAQLTIAQQRTESLKKGGSDIDLVPLWEVDAEVAEKCATKGLPELEFRLDVSLVRGDGEAFTLPAPARGMRPAQCNGVVYIEGEWPSAENEPQGASENGEALGEEAANEEELQNDLEEVAEEPLGRMVHRDLRGGGLIPGWVTG